MDEPSSEDDRRFLEAMKLVREKEGLNQAELAQRMVDQGFTYFSQTTISRLERGERPLRFGEARALAAILRRKVSELIEPDAVTAATDRVRAIARSADTAVRDLDRAVEWVLELQDQMRAELAAHPNIDLSHVDNDYERGRQRAHIYGAQQFADADVVGRVQAKVAEWEVDVRGVDQ